MIGRDRRPTNLMRRPDGRTARPHGITSVAPKSEAATIAADRAEALALTPVSDEIAARLDRFVELLLQWQRTTHLIAPSTVPVIWTRHIADSLQLLPLLSQAKKPAKTIVDLGAGGGFPGLVLACALADVPGTTVHLVESNAKKAAFLREAQRLTGASAQVHCVRAEKFVERPPAPVDAVTARALASLKNLLDLSAPLLLAGAQAVFPKGQDVEVELTEASKYWNIQSSLVPSLTDSQARIVHVQSATRQTAGG
ncbi:MAG: rRNA ((527)-N(7))-methyltransferase RsmG [Xanthobacteraceae bacterium]|jgi:16S rRNA (guanine527-N7)-methyltransferase|nr:rRNA ((527)-N(7))-methyltransferase RsmG [Xanthobacteraceae bacterium]